MGAGIDSGRASKVRGLVGLAAILVLGIAAFVVVAWPALEPKPEGSSSGAAAASTSLATLMPPPLPAQGAPPTPEERRASRVLTNGCSYTSRGIPECGVLMGAAYGANTDPLTWEQSMGHPLGVRRTYWDAADVARAVSTAQQDLLNQRLPWMSFKLPYSWAEMRDGLGDDWARDLAVQMSHVDGPVWLAFHHEPEGDGDVQAWTAMQARLAPIVRAAAPNVAYTIILTGWNQFHGESQYSLESLWPENTKIDIAGFDVYNFYGAERDGVRIDSPTDFEGRYFEQFRRFAKQRDMAWGIAETGFTDRAAEAQPDWVLRTYLSVLEHDGVAFTYFNSTLNSTAPWRLDELKEQEFARALRMTPTL